MRKKKLLFTITIFTLLAILGIGFISPLVLTQYTISSSKLPIAFDGYKIVHISDFHCHKFGNNQSKLISLVQNSNPNIICLTGDIVDEDHDISEAESLISGLVQIAPVFYVSGNHEYYPGAPYSQFLSLCHKYGVTELDNSTVNLSVNDSFIKLSGMNYTNSLWDLKCNIPAPDPAYYNIFMFHDAGTIETIAPFGYDLVLSGHIHGGIIKLPFVGGILGPNYSTLPKYDFGIDVVDSTTLINSSGLGDARIPRWFNPREVIEITLHCQ